MKTNLSTKTLDFNAVDAREEVSLQDKFAEVNFHRAQDEQEISAPRLAQKPLASDDPSRGR